MATRPTFAVRFAYDAGANKSAIPSTVQEFGYPFGSPLPSAEYGQREYEVGEWLAYFGDLSPASDVLVLGRIRATNDPSSADTLRITDEGGTAGATRWIVTQAGSSIVIEATGGAAAASLTLDRDTGFFTVEGTIWAWDDIVQNGIVASPDAGTDRRFGYSTGEVMEIDISPTSGGWQFQRATTGSSNGTWAGASAASSPLLGSDILRPVGSNNTGDVWRRPFPEVEASGARDATVWRVGSISARIDEESNGNVRVRLCKRERATGTESAVTDGSAIQFVVQSGTASGGPQTYTSAADVTALDLDTYSYFFELDVVDLASTGQPIIWIKTSMQKLAAD